MPTQLLDDCGWVKVEETVETLFSLSAARVRGATVRYEENRSRDALAGATEGDIDILLRFLAATRIGFEPPLPPGIGPAMVAPTVKSQAVSNFADRLRDRGLENVERDGSQRIRVDRRRAKVTKFTATLPIHEHHDDLPLACWVAVWTRPEGNTIVTGGHPTVEIASHFDIDTDDTSVTRSGEEYREEFFSILRKVD